MAKSSCNSPKSRDYFITINESAESFEDIRERVNALNFKLYAYILHDKDVLTTENEQTGELEETPKRKHYHLMVELKNPVSFKSIQDKFPGAHIETPKYKKSAYQYLLHNSPNSKEKYQYDINEIITNSLEQVKFIIESETFELFYENLFLRYMAQGTKTSYQFVKRFGLNAYKQYWGPYNAMLSELSTDREMQEDLEREKLAIMEEELPF